jgi:hypothetical protein
LDGTQTAEHRREQIADREIFDLALTFGRLDLRPLQETITSATLVAVAVAIAIPIAVAIPVAIETKPAKNVQRSALITSSSRMNCR